MTDQTSVFDYIPDVKDDFYYITWDSLVEDNGKLEPRKGYNDGIDSFKKAVNNAMSSEMNSKYPKVVRTGIGVRCWYMKETIQEPKMLITHNEIKPEKGSELNLLDEGTFKVKYVGEYKCGTTNYPWSLLTSIDNGYDIVMSFRAINNKILRKKSPHKDLNFTLIDAIDNIPAYWFTVGYLLRIKPSIHIRTTLKTHDYIMNKYETVTGQTITDEVFNKYVYVNRNNATFTINCDLRMPVSPIRQYLYLPKNKVDKREGIITKDIELIQNTAYVWTLLNYGFRLGTNHNVDEVFSHVRIQSPEYLEDFERGHNYNEIGN